ncbi:hypothetical protein [Microbacterium schleiferi]|uniref:Uncharacterized protein n=1 Tax=Microbacterium schleiferi TaxID=69362 RepID=A0ABU7V7F0_9MICO
MSVARMQTEAEVREAIETLEALVARSGLSWEEDAMYTVRRAALAWVDGVCQYCEAEPGDNEYCAIDGSPHPWATNQGERDS